MKSLLCICWPFSAAFLILSMKEIRETSGTQNSLAVTSSAFSSRNDLILVMTKACKWGLSSSISSPSAKIDRQGGDPLHMKDVVWVKSGK